MKKKVCILTFEGNAVATELFSLLFNQYDLSMIYIEDERFALAKAIHKKRGLRWVWYNYLFVQYAKIFHQEHKPQPSWRELADRHKNRFYKISSFVTLEGVQIIKDKGIDIGVMIGTPLAPQALLDAPCLGMLNLHQGRIPDYRGKPPAYWEHYYQEPVMHVTVHRAITKLDAGEILAETTFSIKENPHWIVSKFQASFVSCQLIQEAIEKVIKQAKGEIRAITHKTRTVPSTGILLRESCQLLWMILKGKTK